MAATRAAHNRKLRQENLRELLGKQKHLEKVVVNIKKMEEQGAQMEQQELTALKYATDTRLKLLDKYLPGIKSIELTGEDGESLFPKSIEIIHV